MKKVLKIKYLLLPLTLLLYSCENRVYITNKIFIGMTVNEFKKLNIEAPNNTIVIDGITCDFEPKFCTQILEAVTFKTERRGELLKTLQKKWQNQNDITVDEVVVRSSYDLMVSFVTLVCIRSNKVLYSEKESALICD